MKRVICGVLAAGAMACGGAKENLKAAPPPVDPCPGRPAWTCMGGSGPCKDAAPEYAGQLCSLGIATGLSESLGQTTADAAARANMMKFMEAQAETFNNQIQAAKTTGDAGEEIQRVEAGIKQLASSKVAGVATPKRFYDKATKTTYVLGLLDPEGFAKGVKGLSQSARLSEELRKRIDSDADAVEAKWKAAKEEAAK